MRDIQAGDLVVCVDEDDCPFCTANPDDDDFEVINVVTGRHYRVMSVISPDAEYGCVGLGLAGVPETLDGIGVCVGNFRKLNDEPDNAELIAKIRACKPIKQGVPA